MLRILRLSLLILLIIATTSCLTGVHAQHMGGRRSDSLANRNINRDSLIEERLVALALSGPQYDAAGHQINISENQLSKAKRSWLNLLALSANYNDQTFAKAPSTTTGTQAYVYPKYFFGLTIPLGVIFAMGPEIKIARQGVEVSKDTREELARTLRMEVLSKYRQYKNFTELIGLQNTIVVDEQAGMAQTEKKFKSGTLTIGEYNTANKVYSDDIAKKLNLQLQQDLIKLDLERLIGTRLENALK